MSKLPLPLLPPLLPAVLHEGQVREYDTPDNLLAQPASGEAATVAGIAALPAAGWHPRSCAAC